MLVFYQVYSLQTLRYRKGRPTIVFGNDAVRLAAGYPGVTVTEVQGHGKQRGVTESWRGSSYQVMFLQKMKFEIIVKNADLVRIVEAISSTARTSSVGDGKIFVSNIEDVVRIRTDEHGEIAVG